MATELRFGLAAARLGCAAALLAGAALAHDVWIEPSGFRIEPEALVSIRLVVGEDFAGEPVSRNPARILEFAHRDSGSVTPVPGLPGVDPAGRIRAGDRAGIERVTYRSRPARLDLPAARFERYLEEEGLEDVRAERRRRGEADSPGREAYSRCIQSLLVVGAGGGDGYRGGFDCEYELEPLADPAGLAEGDALELEVRFRGRPVAGARVEAIPKGAAERRVEGRTDARGRVVVGLAGPGPWLVRSLRMVRSEPGSGYEWRSYWASLTFATASARVR